MDRAEPALDAVRVDVVLLGERDLSPQDQIEADEQEPKGVQSASV